MTRMNNDGSYYLSIINDPPLSFEDVIGKEYEKNIIKKMITQKETNGSSKSLIFLHGPCGTGKTFFANALFGELKKHDETYLFLDTSYSKIQSAIIGGTVENIYSIYQFAKRYKKVILFFDGADPRDVPADKSLEDIEYHNFSSFYNALKEIKSKKDDDCEMIIIVASYCFEEKEIKSQFEFDHYLKFSLPSVEEIYLILEKHLGHLIEEEVDLKEIAKKLQGLTHRDIYYFTEKAKELIDDLFHVEDNKEFEYYKINNKMFEEALVYMKK